MEILDIDETNFKQNFLNYIADVNVFCNERFNALNSHKVNSIKYLLFKNNKIRFGLILGIKDHIAISPFSAPYGGFTTINKNVALKHLYTALSALDSYCVEQKIQELNLTLPPTFYGENILNSWASAFINHGFCIRSLDLNYQFRLEKFNGYNSYLESSIKNQFKKAISNDFSFVECKSFEDRLAAYSVIQQNKLENNYPLKLTFDQVQDTMKIIKADFFLVKDKDGNDVAAAMIFRVTNTVAQIIYWGHLDKYSKLYPMNYMAYKVFEYYYNLNYEWVDIGPSSEDGIPNFGLCDFKQNIGCDISLKYSFNKKFINN